MGEEGRIEGRDGTKNKRKRKERGGREREEEIM